MVASILTGVYVCSAESAKSRQHDSVTTVGNADMELGRCVVDFQDVCGTNT